MSYVLETKSFLHMRPSFRHSPLLIILFLSGCISSLGKPDGPESRYTQDQIEILNKRSILLQDLLEDQAACLPPCWWGIHFGQSSDVVEKHFEEVGLFPYFKKDDPVNNIEVITYGIGIFNPELEVDELFTETTFAFFREKLQAIDVLIERPLENLAGEIINIKLSQFSPHSILNLQGEPTAIYLSPQNPIEPGPKNYSLMMAYPEKGLYFSYTTHETEISGSNDQYCFSFGQIRTIEMFFVKPELSQTLEMAIIPTRYNLNIISSELENFSWQNQTGLIVTEFAEIFSGSADQVCVSLIQ